MHNKSFTIIELLLVIAIIGLLSAVVLVSLADVREKSRIAKAHQFDDSIRSGLQDSLIGWWSFDEGSGNSARDSWAGNNIDVIGGSWTQGISNGAYQFDASATTTFSQAIGQGITYTFWFRLTNPVADNSGTFLCAEDETNANTEDNFGQNASTYNYGDTSCGGKKWMAPTAQFNVSDTKWHHFAVTKSSSDSKLCLDGNCIPINNDIFMNIPDIKRIIFNGSCGCSSYGNFVNGLVIDELRIYSKAF